MVLGAIHEQVREEEKSEFLVYFAAHFAQRAGVDKAAADAGCFFDFNCAVEAFLQEGHEGHVTLQRHVVVDAGEE